MCHTFDGCKCTTSLSLQMNCGLRGMQRNVRQFPHSAIRAQASITCVTAGQGITQAAKHAGKR